MRWHTHGREDKQMDHSREETKKQAPHLSQLKEHNQQTHKCWRECANLYDICQGNVSDDDSCTDQAKECMESCNL